MTYLGALINDTGRIQLELSRRVGAASADFRALSRIWRHSSLSRARKLEMFNATVVPKVTYALSTAWLNTAERRRLNGFQCQCLRTIWGIQPSFISRVSNQTVLERTAQKPLSHLLAKQQLLLFGKVARAPEGSIMRDVTFCHKTLSPATEMYVRRRGRPRQEWASELSKLATRLAGSYHELYRTIGSETNWCRRVTTFCNENVII